MTFGCETTEEINELKATVQDNMGQNFQINESPQLKPKKKIAYEEEELELRDDISIHAIKKQNGIEEIGETETKIVKRINRRMKH